MYTFEKYDNYDAYEVPKSNLVDEFVEQHLEYLIGGGRFGAPITYLYNFQKDSSDVSFKLIDLLDPKLNGRNLYKRLVFELKEEYRELYKELIRVGALVKIDGNYRLFVQRKKETEVKVNEENEDIINWEGDII